LIQENQALMHHGSLDNLNNNLCYEWGATFATNNENQMWLVKLVACHE
jgi:hypothetical protein